MHIIINKEDRMNSLGTTIFIAFLCNPAFGEDAPELCGTCWCVNGDEACPAFGPGIYDEFDPALTEVLASFQPDGSGAESFVLTDEAGEDCFPFASSTEPNDEIPLSDLPPCVAPPSSDDANTVCAMQVTGNDGRDDCCGQTYTLFNYSPDEAAALPSGAYVTHEGHCGVCSTAQDLAVMGSKVAKSGRPLDQQSITCTTLFVIGKIGGEITSEFDKLVKCFEDEIGYSSQCARLWAHGATLTSTQCLSSCAGAGGDYNGPPPECELSQCIKCNEDVQGEMFGKFAGRTSLNSGKCRSSLVSSHLISSHLISSHLSSAHLISSHLISSHLISSQLISSHLISSQLISSHLSSAHLISSHLSADLS